MAPPIRESPQGTLEERIMRWLPESFTDDCYEWPKTLSHGYAVIGEGGRGTRKIRVGRWVYERFIGPANGAFMLHSCDNPPCVNPRHLRPGTQQENITEMAAKERGTTKLTADQVRAIRTDPRPSRAVSVEYGVSSACVKAIRARRTWRWLD